ncbi:MAG: hypothetical protein HC913_17425 [Microscillaceae bacterium]|nr:hypothetical protein [Microscillaceae bacterium]
MKKISLSLFTSWLVLSLLTLSAHPPHESPYGPNSYFPQSLAFASSDFSFYANGNPLNLPFSQEKDKKNESEEEETKEKEEREESNHKKNRRKHTGQSGLLSSKCLFQHAILQRFVCISCKVFRSLFPIDQPLYLLFSNLRN